MPSWRGSPPAWASRQPRVRKPWAPELCRLTRQVTSLFSLHVFTGAVFLSLITLLVLKSGQPDSPGRQPRGQGPKQTLSLPYYSAVAGCDWVAFVSTKEMTRSFRRLSEKGATGLPAGGSPGVRLSLFSAVQAFLFTSDPGPWASAYPGVGVGMEISSRTSLPREPSAGCPDLRPWALLAHSLTNGTMGVASTGVSSLPQAPASTWPPSTCQTSREESRSSCAAAAAALYLRVSDKGPTPLIGASCDSWLLFHPQHHSWYTQIKAPASCALSPALGRKQ